MHEHLHIQKKTIISPIVYVLWHINPLHAKLNPICHLLALLGAHRIFHVSRVRVKPYFKATTRGNVLTRWRKRYFYLTKRR
jgi:hypothetical protein